MEKKKDNGNRSENTGNGKSNENGDGGKYFVFGTKPINLPGAEAIKITINFVNFKQ